VEKKKLEIKVWHILIVGIILFLCGMALSYFIFSKDERDIVENNFQEINAQNEINIFVQSNIETNEINNDEIIDKKEELNENNNEIINADVKPKEALETLCKNVYKNFYNENDIVETEKFLGYFLDNREDYTEEILLKHQYVVYYNGASIYNDTLYYNFILGEYFVYKEGFKEENRHRYALEWFINTKTGEIISPYDDIGMYNPTEQVTNIMKNFVSSNNDEEYPYQYINEKYGVR